MVRCQIYEERFEPLTERHVQSVWYDRSIRPDSLYTRDGEPVRVLHPGDWNLGPGPDFKNALLEVGRERRRMRGDVEIHLHPADWDAHGHGDDPAYSNVVGHVTWGCGPDPKSLPKGAVTIWLGRFISTNSAFSPEQIDLTAYPFAKLPIEERPCWSKLHDDPDLASSILSQAGAHRLRAKARRLAALMPPRAIERRQLFYEETLSALGYRWNTRGFRKLAELVPLRQIAEEPESAETAMTSAGQFIDWAKTPTRPGNAPKSRLIAAAKLFSTYDTIRLECAKEFSKRGCREIIKALTQNHILGRGRASAILCNIVVPWAMASGRLSSPPEWLPPEDVSEPVRLTAFRMFGRDHNPATWYTGNGLHIQGLIQIHRDFCLQVHPDCSKCRLCKKIVAD